MHYFTTVCHYIQMVDTTNPKTWSKIIARFRARFAVSNGGTPRAFRFENPTARSFSITVDKSLTRTPPVPHRPSRSFLTISHARSRDSSSSRSLHSPCGLISDTHLNFTAAYFSLTAESDDLCACA